MCVSMFVMCVHVYMCCVRVSLFVCVSLCGCVYLSICVYVCVVRSMCVSHLVVGAPEHPTFNSILVSIIVCLCLNPNSNLFKVELLSHTLSLAVQESRATRKKMHSRLN